MLERLELALGVEPPLELAEDETEEKMSPGGLGKRAPVPAQRLELRARGW